MTPTLPTNSAVSSRPTIANGTADKLRFRTRTMLMPHQFNTATRWIAEQHQERAAAIRTALLVLEATP